MHNFFYILVQIKLMLIKHDDNKKKKRKRLNIEKVYNYLI